MTTYDDVTRWLREAHKTDVTVGQRPSWRCSCGAGSKHETTSDARALAARDRHLQSARKRFPS